MPGQHAKFFPPSASDRLLSCPASLKLTQDMPDTPRIDAAWGSVAHKLSERVKKHGGVASMFLGEVFEQEGFKITVNDEMVEAVTRCVAWCAMVPGDVYIEQRVDISEWCPVPDQFGTSDFIACRPRHITVADDKYGKGVKVFAEENPQAILYALGAIREHDWLYGFETVSIQVLQPRLDHFDTWDTTVEHLLKRGQEFKARFALALSDNPPFGPSEKACKFCKLNGRCRAQAEYLNASTALAFDDIEGEFQTEDPNVLTDAELVHAWRLRGLMSSRMKEIERILIGKMMRDEPLPGIKTVEGKTRRKWKSEEEARLFLTNKLQLDIENIAPRKLVSPAQIEKKMPLSVKLQLENYWIKPAGRPTLADEKDKRAAYKPASLDAFDAEEPDDE